MNTIELAKTTTDISLLEKLSDDEDWWVRNAVAENPNTPTHLLEKLSDDKDEWVRKVIANNPNTPPELKTFMMLKY